MSVQEIPRAQWKKFCDDLTYSHRGWRGNIDLVREDGDPRTIFRNTIFMGITADLDRKEEDAILVTTGERSQEILTHIVRRPFRMQAQFADTGVPELIRLDAASGTTILQFPAVPSPETATGDIWKGSLLSGRR